MGLPYLIIWSFILIIFCTFFGLLIYSIVKKYKIFIGLFSILIVSGILLICYRQGTFLKTKVHNQYIYIIGEGTGSAGSGARYSLEGDDILIEKEKIYRGGLTLAMKFGWKFEAIDSGECSIIYEETNFGQWQDPIIYHITVDEDLNVEMKIDYD